MQSSQSGMTGYKVRNDICTDLCRGEEEVEALDTRQ